MANEVIHTYSNITGWGTADSPLPEDMPHDRASAMLDAGYECFDEIGDPDHGSGIRIYVEYDGDGYMVLMETTSGQFRCIACPDLASYLGLLAQLEPWIRMVNAASVESLVYDVHQLLTTYGEDGPLAAPLAERERVFEERAERRRQIQQGADSKANGKADGVPPFLT